MNGWRELLRAARPATRSLRTAMRAPGQAQLALLRDIVDANANCDFGRAHGFAGIRTLNDYRSAVPIAGYEAFAPKIARIAEGEPDVLTSATVIAFEQTGGTGSGAKLIPYTQASLTAFRDAVLPWLADLARRRPGITRGSVYAPISPATRSPWTTRGGISVGLGSDAAYLGSDLVPAFLELLTVSPEVSLIADVEEWRVETLAQLIARPDLSFVSVWSPTFFLDLVAAIPDLRAHIAPRLDRDGQRRLRSALASGETDASALWPRLDCISCWTDGASSAFAASLAARFPAAAIEPKGLLATEAAITIPTGAEGHAIPALTSCVVEFIDEMDEARLCGELESGGRYRVVVTTWGGLYRYDIGDQLRCTGYREGVPLLRFEGRTGVTSDMVGEKLDDAFVADALSRLGARAVLVPSSEPKPHYRLWLEAPDDFADIARRVDEALRANPQYAYARRIGQLGPVRASHEPGFMQKIASDAVAGGGRLGDTKPTALFPRGEGRAGEDRARVAQGAALP